ncbi:MAG TPA: hypothetical protein VLK65_11805 [Vicinamibacteria bacterium]|nr:hypothetical protein [Vicinamibacteria bacterium]
MKAKGRGSQRAIEAEAQECERTVQARVDELTPIRPGDQSPPIEVLNQGISLDYVTVIVNEIVSQVVAVGEKTARENENGRAKGPAVFR